MVQKKIATKKAPLTVHGLLGSLSYWGTTARVLVVGVLILAAFALNLTMATDAISFDAEVIFLIFGLGTLLMLDLGYVVAARTLPLNAIADRWIVMMSDLALAAFFIVPSLIQVQVTSNKLRIVGLVLALLILAIRVLLGLLFSKRK